MEVCLVSSLTRLERAVDAALYRLGQEALTNALRHARRASYVLVELHREGGSVRLRVSDDGKIQPGATPEPGFGLLGMTERVHLLGGTLGAGPAPEGGWVVEAVLPAQVSP